MSQSADRYHVSGLAITFSFVTAALMVASGTIIAFYGGWELLFGGVERNTNTLIDMRAGTWGIVHLGLGIAMALAGGNLLVGHLWARIVAIAVAVGVLIAGIVALPDSPVWGLFLIVLNLLILWALAFHGHDIEEVTT